MLLRRIALLAPRSRSFLSSNTNDISSTIAEFNKEMESIFGESPPDSFAGSMKTNSSPQESEHTTATVPISISKENLAGNIPILSHIGSSGEAQMVDVSPKENSKRTATATCKVILGKKVFDLVLANQMGKGDVLSVAKIAGISGAKHTSSLIPLCHNISLTHVRVDLRLNPEDSSVEIEGEAACTGKTGVEMEAMTAVSVAGLTVYDMCKAASKEIEITEIRLERKTGGKSGYWCREE